MGAHFPFLIRLESKQYIMPSEAVEKPLEETKPEDTASSDSDDDDSPPELEGEDAAAMQQQSQVAAAAGLNGELVSKAKQSRSEKGPQSHVKTGPEGCGRCDKSDHQ